MTAFLIPPAVMDASQIFDRDLLAEHEAVPELDYEPRINWEE
jgi:hypothetical protein